MEDIFQEIWSADMSGNGVPALRPGEQKDEAIGYVIVDERSTEVGSDHNVIAEVVIPEEKQTTYILCHNILDNYALERASTELIKPEETQEELDFIQAILPTQPIQVARRYMEQSLSLNISDEALASIIRETWFKYGTAGNQRDATGFEHVFVGEQAKDASKIGGYHYWHKYYLDDGGRQFDLEDPQLDRMEYLGTKYGGAEQPEKGILIPEVITLSLVWNAPGGDGGTGRILTKPIGGFFVGLSPEGLIALGLVRCRTNSGKEGFINGAKYSLDLHRLDDEPNSIRTFFPRFVRSDTTEIIDGGDATESDDSGDVKIQPGSFKIVSAMVNPENPEGGREFLQIINTTNEVSTLKGWKVVAPNNKIYVLSDVKVAPGDIHKYTLPSSSGELRNKGGEIHFISASGKLAQISTYTEEQGSREGVPILF